MSDFASLADDGSKKGVFFLNWESYRLVTETAVRQSAEMETFQIRPMEI